MVWIAKTNKISQILKEGTHAYFNWWVNGVCINYGIMLIRAKTRRIIETAMLYVFQFQNESRFFSKMADSITWKEEIITWVGKIVQNLPQKTYHGEPSMRKE